MYKNPDLNNSLLPTLEQMRRYIRAANNITQDYRDPRMLMSTLQQIVQVDLNLLGLNETRILAVLGFDHTISWPEGVTPSEAEKTQIVAMKSRFKKSKMNTIFRMILIGRLYGASAMRLIWKNSAQETLVSQKQAYDLTELDFDLANDDGLIFLNTNTNTGALAKSPIDPETHIVVRYNPLEGIKSNFIGALMRTNMIYSWIKYYDYFNWAKGNEKYADPTVWASYRRGAQPGEVDAVIAGLQTLGTDSKAAFSDDVKLNLIESMKTGSISAHKELVETIKSEQSISILGQTLTTDLQGKGSKAAAQVHNLVRADIMWADLLAVQDVVSYQYIVQDYLKNYGEPKNAFPIFHFLTEETEDVEANARIFSEVRSADPSVKFRKDELYKKIGFTEPQAADVTI